jgi:hypothetical protein
MILGLNFVETASERDSSGERFQSTMRSVSYRL